MNLKTGHIARIYFDQPGIPERLRKEYTDQEIYYVDRELTGVTRTAIGDQWTVKFDNEIVTLYANTLVPLVYVLSKDMDILSVHSTIDSAVDMIEKIERIDKDQYAKIHQAIVDDHRYDSNDSTYTIMTREMY